MSDEHKELSPIMRQRLAEIGEITPDEKERIRDGQRLNALLGDFYRNDLTAENLREQLEEIEQQDKQYLLKEAYVKLRSSFKWKELPFKFTQGNDGTLKVESREESEEVAEEEPVMELNEHNFDEMVNKYPILVVDCWADWCAPCRMVAPVIEELAKDYAGKITFGKLNVDFNQSVAKRYRIMSIPTLLVFKNGQLVDQKVGAMSKGILEPELIKHL